MTKRTPDEAQDNVAAYFESLASATEDGRGIFLGQELSAAETRAVVGRLNTLAKQYREKADEIRNLATQE